MSKRAGGETVSSEVTFPVIAKAEVPVTANSGPIPGTAWVENLMNIEIDITLTDGTNLHMAPLSRGGGSLNKSREFPKKLLPAYAKRLAQKGEIRIVDAGGK